MSETTSKPTGRFDEYPELPPDGWEDHAPMRIRRAGPRVARSDSWVTVDGYILRCDATLKSLLHACLDAYTDEPTGLSGREMLEELLDRGDYDASRRYKAKQAAARLLDDGE